MIVGKSTSVEFKSGMLLSKEMLEQLEYQTHLHEIQYSNYPDGILYGLDITVEDEKLFFSSGLIKYKDISSSLDTCQPQSRISIQKFAPSPPINQKR